MVAAATNHRIVAGVWMSQQQIIVQTDENVRVEIKHCFHGDIWSIEIKFNLKELHYSQKS